MKEEVKRIMKLVQEGKLSPDDAAELIDAFDEGERSDQASAPKDEGPSSADARETGSKGGKRDPVRSFLDFMDGIGKEVSQGVNWQDVAKQVRESLKKGAASARVSVEHLRQGGWFGASQTKEVELPLKIAEGKPLRIDNVAGDIRVVGGQAESRVMAKAVLRAGDEAEARRKADEYTLVVEESDHAVIIRQPSISGVTVDIEVQLAVKAPLEVRTTAGDVSVLDTGMSARVVGQSGDVHLRGLEGSVDVTLQNGDLTVEDVPSANVTIENKSGDVVLRRVVGNMTTRTASGDVCAMACGGGTMSFESVSGDVRTDLAEPVTKSLNVRTVNGDAHVTVPDGCDCRVSLSTLRGVVTCEVELADEARMDQHVTGRLGEGNGTLDVSAVNGDITLKQRAEVVTETA